MAGTVHLGDIGTVFEATIVDQDNNPVDVSGASTKELWFKKPGSSTTLAKPANFTNTGTDGKVRYTTIAGDLDTTGEWNWAGYVVLPSGTWHSDPATFQVASNLK